MPTHSAADTPRDLLLVKSAASLPSQYAALFPPGPLAGTAWFDQLAAHAIPNGAAPCYAVAASEGAVFPLLQSGRHLSGFTTPYTLDYWPVLPHDATPAATTAAARRLGEFCRGWPTVRLDAVPAEWPGLPAFLSGIRLAGLRVQRFEHFGNWHEPLGGRSWPEYLAARPGALRETVRRKLRRVDGSSHLELFTASAGLERGIAAFEAVYRASWKQPEPFPEFNAALMRAMAALGYLRLGVLWAGDRPAAAQLWVVADGTATVLKLAHDEAFKPLSPGTVLTASMIRLLIEEGVDGLDFGRGDDPYKASWTTQRRQRIGLLLMNPWRPGGLAAIARAAAGRIRHRVGSP